jgi:putative pyruvate formate lyase activating enzyme
VRSAEDFVVNAAEPAYAALGRRELTRRATAAVMLLERCEACPRACGVNRLAGETGTCRTGRLARVVSAFAHLGEEACLTGWAGSGTIFLASCNLSCVFCQNYETSQQASGVEVTSGQLADLMLSLQQRGCHNINLVTPEHVVPQMLEGLVEAIASGLQVPIVYNTSAYDSVESLRLLDGIVDIYMPDFKFWEPATADTLCHAEDYPQRARAAIAEMHRQVGALKLTRQGLACRGVLVRHLVLPGLLNESSAIFRWLAELCPDTYVNTMGQYRPEHLVGTSLPDGQPAYQSINRRPTPAEMSEAYRLAREAGLWRFDK